MCLNPKKPPRNLDLLLSLKINNKQDVLTVQSDKPVL